MEKLIIFAVLYIVYMINNIVFPKNPIRLLVLKVLLNKKKYDDWMYIMWTFVPQDITTISKTPEEVKKWEKKCKEFMKKYYINPIGTNSRVSKIRKSIEDALR